MLGSPVFANLAAALFAVDICFHTLSQPEHSLHSRPCCRHPCVQPLLLHACAHKLAPVSGEPRSQSPFLIAGDWLPHSHLCDPHLTSFDSQQRLHRPYSSSLTAHLCDPHLTSFDSQARLHCPYSSLLTAHLPDPHLTSFDSQPRLHRPYSSLLTEHLRGSGQPQWERQQFLADSALQRL